MSREFVHMGFRSVDGSLLSDVSKGSGFFYFPRRACKFPPPPKKKRFFDLNSVLLISFQPVSQGWTIHTAVASSLPDFIRGSGIIRSSQIFFCGVFFFLFLSFHTLRLSSGTISVVTMIALRRPAYALRFDFFFKLVGRSKYKYS